MSAREARGVLLGGPRSRDDILRNRCTSLMIAHLNPFPSDDRAPGRGGARRPGRWGLHPCLFFCPGAGGRYPQEGGADHRHFRGSEEAKQVHGVPAGQRAAAEGVPL